MRAGHARRSLSHGALAVNFAASRDWYADLAAQNYAMLPGFNERQVEAGQEIFETLIPHIQKGAVKVIVDIGCGSGEVIVDLARRLSHRQLNLGEAVTNSVILVGLDSSTVLIEKAKAKIAAVTLSESIRCEFEACDTPSNLPWKQLDRLLKKNGDNFTAASAHMAVLCLGHTIFHLPYLDNLFEALENDAPSRPLMFMVDVYHSWDSTIAELKMSSTGTVAEPRSFTENGAGEKVLNVLFTRWVENSEQQEVERGLSQTCDLDINGDEVIVTRQLARTSGDMAVAFAIPVSAFF